MTAPRNPAFKRNAWEFATELSETLTATISHIPLRCSFVRGKDRLEAILEFVPSPEDSDFRYVELGNGIWINILQRLVPHPKDARAVQTAKYSYSCSLGPNVDDEWLIRYDYVPVMGEDDFPYPVSHMHINAENSAYDSFMEGTKREGRPLSRLHFPTKRVSLEDFIEHLIVEFEVPVLHGKDKEDALETLNRGRERFERRRTRDD